MPEVKWVKLYTDFFDNRKIRFIRSMPDGIEIIYLWLFLLAKAGAINDDGCVHVTEDIPYTTESLAHEVNLPHNTVKMGVEILRKTGLLEKEGLQIGKWEQYQNVVGLDQIREQTRERVRRYRERKRLTSDKSDEKPALTDGTKTSNVTCDATETLSNAPRRRYLEEDLDLRTKNKTLEGKRDNTESFDSCSLDANSARDRIPYQAIADAYNQICVSLKPIQSLTSKRKQHIRARMKQLPDITNWETLFHKVESSTFLKGDNKREWAADFDWIVKNEQNAIKILEGKYDDAADGGEARMKQKYAGLIQFMEDEEEEKHAEQEGFQYSHGNAGQFF